MSSAIDSAEQFLRDDGTILCIRFAAGDRVVEACRAAARGGLRVLEITLTTPDALASIRTLSQDKALLVGAGTVLTVGDVEAVAEAGGRFALSPVFDPQVLAAATKRGLLCIPGTATPTEMDRAYRGGARMVKVFPAAALGGPAYLRAVRGPLPHIPMIPTSGPTSENLADYLDAGAAAVGIGAEVFPSGFTAEQVEDAARRVRTAVNQAQASH